MHVTRRLGKKITRFNFVLLLYIYDILFDNVLFIHIMTSVSFTLFVLIISNNTLMVLRYLKFFCTRSRCIPTVLLRALLVLLFQSVTLFVHQTLVEVPTEH